MVNGVSTEAETFTAPIIRSKTMLSNSFLLKPIFTCFVVVVVGVSPSFKISWYISVKLPCVGSADMVVLMVAISVVLVVILFKLVVILFWSAGIWVFNIEKILL